MPVDPIDAGPIVRLNVDAGSDAGIDGGSRWDGGTTCPEVKGAFVDLLNTSLACEQDEDCRRLDDVLPANDEVFCGRVGTLTAGNATLTSLTQRWNALHCGTDFSCGSTPGMPKCDQHRCVIDDPITRCTECPTTIDPHCTVGGQNARNECYARECLGEAIAHAGVCASSTQCLGAGGHCEAIDPVVAVVACSDGTAPWEDGESLCPGGNLPSTCCVPRGVDAGAECTYVAGASYALDRDPFTCELLDPGVTVCIQPGLQRACDWEAQSIGLGMDAWDASVRLVAHTDAGLEVFGRRGVAAFHCTGVANNLQLTDTTTWSCTGCAAGDAGCTSCIAHQQAFCPIEF